jgi:hypothetical protein
MEKIKKENLGIEIDEETFLGIIMSVLLGTKSSHSTSRREVVNVMKQIGLIVSRLPIAQEA